jgi:hypothetical protein
MRAGGGGFDIAMTRPFGTQRTPFTPIIVVAAASLAAGMCVAVRPSAAPLMAFAAVLVMLSLSWRRGVLALLLVLPFSGVPVFMAGGSGLALRDVAIILPLYVAFALAITRDETLTMPRLGVATPGLAVFAALVVLHMPVSQSMLVGAIAAKVWLAYIPMLALGYCYVRRIDDFDRVLRITALVGLIPAAIALGEWYFATRNPVIVNGHWILDFGPFRYLYGGSYDEARGSVVVLSTPFHLFVIPRIPSTFTGVTQFYGFALVAFAAGLSQAMRHGGRDWTVCAAVLGAGTIATGARLAYICVPLMVMMAAALAGPSKRQVVRSGLAGLALLAAGVVVMQSPIEVMKAMPDHLLAQMSTAARELQGSGLSRLIGHGTGWDTRAALQYGGSADVRYIENWFAKAARELGALGLVSIAVVLASLSMRLLMSLRRMEPATRRLAAPVTAVLIITVASLFKGPMIDVDPLNVYFWLLAGMLLGVARLSERGDGEESRGDSPDAA